MSGEKHKMKNKKLTDSVLVWAIRQLQEVQADDKVLLAALKEKYAKVKSQEACQQDWRDISQQPGEKSDDYFQRLEIAYDNAYRDPEFREPKVSLIGGEISRLNS